MKLMISTLSDEFNVQQSLEKIATGYDMIFVLYQFPKVIAFRACYMLTL